MRKAAVGLFNIKKSKNKEVEEFEASDEWLMGLADDEDDRFDALGDGPNASIPKGLASLAPADERRFDPLQADDDATIAQGDDASELLDGDDVDLSSWHFPDLTPTTDLAGVDDVDLPPISGSFGSELFDSGSAFASDLDTGLGADLESQIDDTVLKKDALKKDALEKDALKRNALERDVLDDENVDVMAAIGSDPFPPAEPLPQVALESHPVDDAAHDPSTGPVPRGHEADMLCEILGVEGGASWADLRAAHAAAMSEYDPRLESDEDRVALASAIRREMNSTYASLRLLAAG